MNIKKAKLKTLNMFKDVSPDEADYQLWKRIEEYMDGETAFICKSGAVKGEYVFLGLADEEKNKELHYMFEQDSMFGLYIDSREDFDRDWESGDYEPDGCHYLKPENVDILESETEDSLQRMEKKKAHAEEKEQPETE